MLQYTRYLILPLGLAISGLAQAEPPFTLTEPYLFPTFILPTSTTDCSTETVEYTLHNHTGESIRINEIRITDHFDRLDYEATTIAHSSTCVEGEKLGKHSFCKIAVDINTCNYTDTEISAAGVIDRQLEVKMDANIGPLKTHVRSLFQTATACTIAAQYTINNSAITPATNTLIASGDACFFPPTLVGPSTAINFTTSNVTLGSIEDYATPLEEVTGAQTDAENLFFGALDLDCDRFLHSPITSGTTTFDAGVYCLIPSSSFVELGGTVVFNTAAHVGDLEGMSVILVESDLAINAGTTFTSGTAEDILWVVFGDVTINSTGFEGNMIAFGDITVSGSAADYTARLLSLNGSIIFNNSANTMTSITNPSYPS